jgi:hypothetical protein
VTWELSGELESATRPGGRPANGAQPEGLFRGALKGTSTGILILITIIAFEAMAVAAALPTAARDLHGVGAYGWAFTGFLVANVLGMVVAGQMSDSRGPRLPLVAGLVAFACGLALAGTASWMAQRDLLRVGRPLTRGAVDLRCAHPAPQLALGVPRPAAVRARRLRADAADAARAALPARSCCAPGRRRRSRCGGCWPAPSSVSSRSCRWP